MMKQQYSIEEAWKSMLYDLYNKGTENHKDDSLVVENIGGHYFIKNPINFSPLALNVNSKTFIHFIKKGAFDIQEYPIKGEALADYVDSINQEDKIFIHTPEKFTADKDCHKPFVYTYPERLQALFCSNTKGEIDCINQLMVIVDRLKNNLGSNRAIAVLYQAGLDSQEIDIPCLQLVQALVRDNLLVLSVFFRSNDIYGAFPSNMLFITNLGLMIQNEINKEYPDVKFHGIDYHVSSMHYYKTDEDAVKSIMQKK